MIEYNSICGTNFFQFSEISLMSVTSTLEKVAARNRFSLLVSMIWQTSLAADAYCFSDSSKLLFKRLNSCAFSCRFSKKVFKLVIELKKCSHYF